MDDQAGRVLKSLRPGQPGTKKWVDKYGRRLVKVRYRGNPRRRVRATTVELVVEEAFWDSDGFVDVSSAVSHY